MKRCAKRTTALRESFANAWRQLGARLAPDFTEIVARYSEPHRAYHTLEHLLECLAWLAVSRDFAERAYEVELALFYHDVVYDPWRTDNENRSAKLFRFHARASHLPEAQTARIASLIEGTATHGASHGDGALLNDIDLAVLGASPHGYARYECQIRREYEHVEEPMFRAGRERILRAFLEWPSIYSTPFFGQRLETQARTNLSRSLAALQCSEPVGRT
jgi:predicted metal-dependent HD superfamily phosphohydrolase